MDVGPLNVLGKRTSLVDPIVHEIIAKLEAVIHSPDAEIEARLGIISQDQKRLFLPVLTECVIDTSIPGTSGKPLRYEFVPDLGKETFDNIQKRLELLLSGKLTETPPNPVFKVNAVTRTHTVDEVYKKPTQCRVSYDKSTYGLMEDAEPIEVIVKEPIERMDIFSGHYPDIDEEGAIQEEGETRHPYDYRISVNRERKLDPRVVATLNRADCQMIRDKKRISYEMKAWTVDLTRVSILNQSGTNDKYEVEIELKRELLAEQLDRRAKGKQHGAYQILTDFLYFVRDLAHVFGVGLSGQIPVRSFGGYKFPEMTSCEPSEKLKSKYRDVLGTDVYPIIGDYVYHVLEEIRPPGATASH